MRCSAIVMAVVLFFATPAWAQAGDSVTPGNPLRTISVTGTVETQVAPDMVVWRISLSDTHEVLGEAKAASDASVKAILALRDELGIKEGDLQTGTLSIRKEYHEDEHRRRQGFKHFRVYRSITIRQRDLARFDEFIDAFVSSTDLEVSFSYQNSKIHETRAETRLKALKVAHEKASDLAKVVGAKLGKVVTISEHGPGDNRSFHNPLSNSNYISFDRQAEAADQSSATFIPGAIDVKMTVYATFELE